MQHYLHSAGLDLLPVELGWPLVTWLMLSRELRRAAGQRTARRAPRTPHPLRLC